MSLHPQVESVLTLINNAARRDYHEMPAHEARAIHDLNAPILNLAADELVHIRDITIPGGDGLRPARVYADREPHNLPVVLWLHGGGHTIGSLDGYDPICRRLARDSGALIVSLDYRLAPENKFPAALDDAFAALLWLRENADNIGGDRARLALAGDSAGGNLSAVCALLARQQQLNELKAQVLVYPAVASHLDFESHDLFGDGYLLSVASIRWFQAQYLNHEDERNDWRFAPLLAQDHSALAPAMVMVASHDPLRDEGIAYARQLEGAGTHVELVQHHGMIHAFWSLAGAIDEGARSIRQAGTFLRRWL